MGSKAVDQSTQQKSASNATALESQQVANATQAQGNSNAAFGTLFGKTGADGKLSGGTVSSFLDPGSLQQNGLNSTYGNAFNTVRNANAQTAKNATSTTLQSLASRGQGSAPSGFAADQLRKAHSDAAASNAQTFAGLSQQQLQDALQNYWQANQLLNSYGTNQAQNALTGNSNAQSTNTSLYGTASQQKPSALGTVLGAAAGAAGAYYGAKK